MTTPLERDELRDVIDLALWAGGLLMEYGAETQRVEEAVHRFGIGLGCDQIDVLVSPNVIIATTHSGPEFRTKARRVQRQSVDMSRIAAISHLSHQVLRGEINRFQVRAELETIHHTPTHYNRWLVVLLVGLACGSFSRLFGGDWPAFLMTVAAASLGMVIRQELHRRHFNPLLITTITAFAAGLVASLAAVLALSATPRDALAASVLLLVPGVPLINSAEDLIRGHMVTGIVRGVTGALLAGAIALGLLLAMSLMGVSL